ncbi:MAG: hypothetical protein IKO39_10235, partial [Treponema sp.]|nr:hypothetical protein [Treponema sp.]
QGKIEGLNSQISQIEDEMKSAEATESFKKKATYVIADLRAQIAQLNKSSATAASTAAAEFTKEWVSKNLTGLKQIEDERAKSLAQLNEKAKKSFGTNYEQKDDYNAELDELNKYYDKKVSLYKQDLEENVKAVNDLNYQTRGLELSEEQAAVAKVFEEKRKSIEELNSLAKAAYGDEFQTETDYIRQKTALEDYYAHELAKSKKDLEDTAHSRRLSHIQEENQKALEAAASRLTGKGGIEISDAANYAEASAKISMQNTDLGNVLNGGTFGGGVLIQFIKAITESLAAIQSVNDVLNFAKTVTESLFAVISPILDSWLKPLADLLRDIGTEIGTVLAPVLNSVTLILVPLNTSLKLLSSVLQIVGAAFEWLNNKVIVPFGNIVIDIINALLGVINLIPGVNIAKLNKLSLVGDAAEELADEMTAATDRIKKKYQRMEDQVNDHLRSQISSLHSQYELGLITRDGYNAQAEKYNSSAYEEILSIEKEMAEALKAIEGNTATIPEGVSSAGSFFSTLGSNIASAASSAWQGIKNTATTIGSSIAKVAGAAWNGVKNAASSVWNWVAGLFGHADGSTGIEFDHIARVH